MSHASLLWGIEVSVTRIHGVTLLGSWKHESGPQKKVVQAD